MKVVLFEDRCRDGAPVGFVLSRAGVACEWHHEPGAIVRAVLAGTPDAIVWALRPESDADLATLRLIKLIVPEVPLLVVEPESLALSPENRNDLRPTFVGRLPVNAVEFFEVIDGLRESTTSV
jgi:hypothetical protein